MKLKCLAVIGYSVVAIVTAMLYFMGNAVAEPKKHNEKYQSDDSPASEPEHFDNRGSDTLGDSPTPTFEAAPPPHSKSQKPAKDKRDDGGGVVEAAVSLPDLTIIGITVTPVSSPAGSSGLPLQNATLTVVIRNAGSGDANGFTLTAWATMSATDSPPNFGSIGDFNIPNLSLPAGAELTTSFSFTFRRSPEAYRAWAIVDSGSHVTEANENNNRTHRQYYVQEIGSFLPFPFFYPAPDVLIREGTSHGYQIKAKNFGAPWPLNQPAIVVSPVGAGTVGNIVTTPQGQTNFTFFATPGFEGLASITASCGQNSVTRFIEMRSPGIVGPADVPGLSQYFYDVIPAGANPTNFQWSVDKPNVATLVPFNNNRSASIKFANANPEIVTVTVSYSLGGGPITHFVEVAVVKVEVLDDGLFDAPGLATQLAETPRSAVVLDVPLEKEWVTAHDPGSKHEQFVYKGRYHSGETVVRLTTGHMVGAVAVPAWSAATTFKLTAPTDRGSAIGKIQIGFFQHVTRPVGQGTATYRDNNDQFAGTRKSKTPAIKGLDWKSPTISPSDKWPWFFGMVKDPSPPSGNGTQTIDVLDAPDTPFFTFPKFFAPNDQVNNSISSGINRFLYDLSVAARTKDDMNRSSARYFQYTLARLTVDVQHPVADPPASQVTLPQQSKWQFTTSSTLLDANITPATILWSTGNTGFHMWPQFP